MKSSKIITFLKEGTLNVPTFVLKNYKKLNITSDELILLIYLINEEEDIIFDVKKISLNTGEDMNKTLELINSLIDKKIITLKIIKNNNKISEEYLNTTTFYQKLASILIEDEKKDNKDIYSMFEKEFGRSISPIEYELINSWIEANHSEEMIYTALKEAVLNNVFNFKYIDKILFDWKKKNYKTPKDIKTIKKETENVKKDLFEYDWLDDNDV